MVNQSDFDVHINLVVDNIEKVKKVLKDIKNYDIDIAGSRSKRTPEQNKKYDKDGRWELNTKPPVVVSKRKIDDFYRRRREHSRERYEKETAPTALLTYRMARMATEIPSDENGDIRSFGIHSLDIDSIWGTIVDKFVDFTFGKIPQYVDKGLVELKKIVDSTFGFDFTTGEKHYGGYHFPRPEGNPYDFYGAYTKKEPFNIVHETLKRIDNLYSRGRYMGDGVGFGMFMGATDGGYDNRWYDENGENEEGYYDFNPRYTHSDNTNPNRDDLPTNSNIGGPETKQYNPNFRARWWRNGEGYKWDPDWNFRSDGNILGNPEINREWNNKNGYYQPDWSLGGKGWRPSSPEYPLLGGEVGEAPKQTKQTKDNDTVLEAESYRKDKPKQVTWKGWDFIGNKLTPEHLIKKMQPAVSWLTGKAMWFFKLTAGLFTDLYKILLKSIFKPATALMKGFVGLLRDAAGKSQIIQAIHQMVIVPFVIMFEYLLIPAIKIVAPMISTMVKLIVQNKDKITAVGNKLAELFSAVLTPFLESLSDKSFWDNPFAGLLDSLTSVLSNIKSFMDSNSDLIGDILVGIFESGMRYLASSASMVADIFNVVADALRTALEGDAKTKLLDAITQSIVLIFGAIEKVVRTSEVMSVILEFASLLVQMTSEAISMAMSGSDENDIKKDAISHLARMDESQDIYYDKSTGRVYGSNIFGKQTMGLYESKALYDAGIFTETRNGDTNTIYINEAIIEGGDRQMKSTLNQLMDVQGAYIYV